METRMIATFIVLINVSLLVGANPLEEKNTNNTIDSYETQEVRPKRPRNPRSKLGLASVRPAQKMAEMLLKSATETITNSVAREDADPVEEGNRKILKFGKRVIESIKRHGIADKEARLIKSGKYRIDWWKRDRRLERIRKRLSEELQRKPELKKRLRSMGWRNASEPISHYEKVHSDRSVTKKPTNSENDSGNALLYRTLVMSFEPLRNSASTMGKETGTKEPVIFVYMPITVASSASEIDRIKEAAMSDLPEIDSPTKFSLNAFDEEDFEERIPDIGVVDITGSETSTSRGEESTPPSRSSGQVCDSDRLLQLIPLVIEELRSGLVSEEERREFGWIFGKRLWQLLVREASKRHGETMDRDLAMFLLKGELVERDPENGRRRRRQRRDVLPRPIVAEDTITKKRDYDYDFEDENDDDRNGLPPNDWSSRNNADDKKLNEASFVELIELAAKHESRKLEEEEKRRVKEKKLKKKWMDDMDDDYDEYSYEDGNN